MTQQNPAPAQQVTRFIMVDCQDKIAFMLKKRGWICDWYADIDRFAKHFALPNTDPFIRFHVPDLDYKHESHDVMNVAVPPAFPFASNIQLFQKLSHEVILTAHKTGDLSHSVAVFAQVTGATFKKEHGEEYQRFIEHFHITTAIFAMTGKPTHGAMEVLKVPGLVVEPFNIEDSAFEVILSNKVPADIAVVPPELHDVFLREMQCIRPATLHRKQQEYTPEVLPAQDPKDKVSRFYGSPLGTILRYSVKTGSCYTNPIYRHVRERALAPDMLANNPATTAASRSRRATASGSALSKSQAVGSESSASRFEESA